MSTTHRHHQPGRGWRLVLARLCLDRLAENVLIHELGDCPHCWQQLADQLADIAVDQLHGAHGTPALYPGGRVESSSVDWVTSMIALALDAADRDAA